MKRRFALLSAVIALAILSTGCLQFLSQDVYLWRSKSGKDLFALFVYRGLQSANAPGQMKAPVDKDAAELAKMLTQDDKFFVMQPYVPISLADIRKPASNEAELKKDHPRAYKFYEFVRDNVNVRSGGAYEEKGTGLLNAYQVVQIHNAKKFVKLANAAMGEGIADAVANPQKRPLLAPMLAKYPLTSKKLEALGKKGKYRFIDFQDAAVQVNLPSDPAEKATIGKNTVQRFFSFKQSPSTQTLANTVNFVIDHPISVAQKPDELSVTVGYPDSRTNSIVPPIDPLKMALYQNNLRSLVSNGSVWLGTMETSAIAQEFLADPEAFVSKRPVAGK